MTPRVAPDGAWYVPIRPMARAAGLAWPGELRRIRQHPVLSEELREAVPGRSMTACLPATMIGFWLATAAPEAIRDLERRERLLRFQRQCAHALSAGIAGRGGEVAL